MAYRQDFRKRVIAFVNESRTKAETTKEWLSHMTIAQCTYLDTYGRKERVTVNRTFPEITQLLGTVEIRLKVFLHAKTIQYT